ncbi:MAG: iron transporter [Candidatus Woykebacteria bacterium GWB1_45_5]|uniref:Iron transporter n=2 Tax=Candidatus Woykeibacteriota TaxID=1817899 RepID=A0A1G1WAJ2_9BACT|nr:MAG: iron transporter [Candidatus Woykebacteria bacterium GWB1_45_5]
MKKLKKFLSKLGPGLITGASDDDPSGIATYSIAGASFGYALNWLTLFLYPLMTIVQEMCGRIGLVTGKGLAGVIKANYPKSFLYFVVFLLLIANTINIGADIGAMAASAKMLIDVPFFAWAILFTVLILALEILISYKAYAKFLKWLTVVLFAYVLTAFVVSVNWGEVFKDLIIPTLKLDDTYLAMMVAFLGTTISPYLFFWQTSEEVEEEVAEHKIVAFGKGRPRVTKGEIGEMRIDTAVGMFFSNTITFFIIVTTASTLFAAGIRDIQTAQDAAKAIEPLVANFPYAGTLAKLLFTTGLVGVGLLAVPVLAGSAAYALSEAFGWREGLYLKFKRAHGFYGVIIFSTLIGLMMNFVGINPIRALFYTAVINGIIAIPLLVIIILVSNNRNILGGRVNGVWSNALGWLTFFLMGAATVSMLVSWLL